MDMNHWDCQSYMRSGLTNNLYRLGYQGIRAGTFILLPVQPANKPAGVFKNFKAIALF